MLNKLAQVGLLIFGVALFASLGIFQQIKIGTLGYRHDEGVLNEGKLIDYYNYVANRNKSPVAKIDGVLMHVSTWKISYIDNTGKFGACDYYTPVGGNSPKIGTHVKCDPQQLQFN